MVAILMASDVRWTPSAAQMEVPSTLAIHCKKRLAVFPSHPGWERKNR
jgi:hypothetical protein